MSIVSSPNMSLPIPVVGTETGPQYANDINAALTIIDQHTHTIGSGVPITPGAININAPLSFNNQSATELGALTLLPQSSAPASTLSLYASGSDLYFIDGSGNQVQITSGGAVNATSSGISSGTASASFVSGVLVVNAAANTPANVQAASILIGNNVANSKFVTLSPPNALASNYSLVLPQLPSAPSVVSLDTSGNMGTQTYDQVGQNMTSVGANAIQVTTTRSTGTTVGTGGVAISNSSGSNTFSPAVGYQGITNLNIGITTSGRPIVIGITPVSGGTADIFSSGGTNFIQFFVDNVPQGQIVVGSGLRVPGAISNVLTLASGVHGVALGASVGSGTLTINDIAIYAYEL